MAGVAAGVTNGVVSEVVAVVVAGERIVNWCEVGVCDLSLCAEHV